MATITSIRLSGRVGQLIFSVRGGSYYARLAPATVRQTANSTARSTNLALAARVSKLLRQSIGELLPFPKDKNMQNRFCGSLMKWLGRSAVLDLPAQQNLPYLSGFQFNAAAELTACCRLPFTVNQPGSGGLQVVVPAFTPVSAFRPPAGTRTIRCRLQSAACNLLQPEAMNMESRHELDIAYNEIAVPGQVFHLPVPTAAGYLAITVMAIEFLDARGILISGEVQQPTGILDARYC